MQSIRDLQCKSIYSYSHQIDLTFQNIYQFYNKNNMTSFRPFQNDLFPDEQIEFKNCSDLIGPWIQNSSTNHNTTKSYSQTIKNTNKVIPVTQANGFRARKTFKKSNRFTHQIEGFDQNFDTIQPIKGIKMKKRNLSSTSHNQKLMCHPECEEQCRRKNLVPLAATMYVYHCKGQAQSPNKAPKSSQNRRNQTICSSKTHQEIGKTKQKPYVGGSNNLQNILKLKQKLRAKNQTYVRKMKQKIKIGSEQDKKWESDTLHTMEQKPKKYLILQKQKDNLKYKNYWGDWRYLHKDTHQSSKFVQPNGYPIIIQ